MQIGLLEIVQRRIAMASRSYSVLVLLTLGLVVIGQSSPLYDIYRVEREPDPIPMAYLRDSFEVEFPGNQVYDDVKAGEIWNTITKRTRHSGSNSHSSSSSSSGNPTIPNSCCPTVIDVIQPTHGKNRAGDLVELYNSDAVRQRFYENSCAPSVADEPCRYLDRKHTSQSRCVQQYSYTYAMVRDFGAANGDWKLDYIQIRSGCSCHISPSN